ncbi:hypothetical protein B0G71_5918 [Paraburkholderia sp. BL27I4N3]|uniref:hypothetical protein n=1 Tax=Paraburkholderia sp. BL27I4N3 TaxID=1938805 RepID=UPI000E2833A2|nr:hypothetical protein [Paraburkholderia sp. BL27I4N3]REE22696.1 hypothetical protein B0G71_5918 [Paraburkholderia sp. BL27I4N3]
MNKFLRNTLIAGMIALPTAAFAQSAAPIDEMQVETVAYEVIGIDSPQMSAHTAAALGSNGTHASTAPAELLHPGYDVGLKSIYLRH